jgi:2-dehydro-3-deoxygalactonokinase
MSSPHQANWIAADWGTTHLRVWSMSQSNEILDHRQSENGMGKLVSSQFEVALLDLVEDCLQPGRQTPVVICGMAGARQGWIEAPYLTTPCPPPALSEATVVPGTDPRLDVRILPGVRQMTPADVMRGEETQIAGFLSLEPEFEGRLCLPGTHTKWVELKKGTIRSFSTYMTGELFNLLSKQSVLRHGIAQAELDQNAFQTAIRDINSAPATLTEELFRIRAEGLLSGLSPAAAYSRLSGLLIGAELAAVKRGAAPNEQIVILGSDRIAAAYELGLTTLGLPSKCLPAEDITLRGLTLAYSSLKDLP